MSQVINYVSRCIQIGESQLKGEMVFVTLGSEIWEQLYQDQLARGFVMKDGSELFGYPIMCDPTLAPMAMIGHSPGLKDVREILSARNLTVGDLFARIRAWLFTPLSAIRKL